MNRTASRRLAAIAAVGMTIVAVVEACGGPDAIVAHQIPLQCVAPGNPCQTSRDCCDDDGGADTDGGSSYFCAKGTCDAEGGTCQPRTTSCDPTPGPNGPLCGCSGIWYWNDCLRKQHGESATVTPPNMCQTRPCSFDEAGACPQGTYCGVIYGADCQPFTDPRLSQTSACWALPATCSSHQTVGPYSVPIANLFRAVSCNPSTMGACVDLCTALKEQAPISRIGTCQ